MTTKQWAIVEQLSGRERKTKQNWRKKRHSELFRSLQHKQVLVYLDWLSRKPVKNGSTLFAMAACWGVQQLVDTTELRIQRTPSSLAHHDAHWMTWFCPLGHWIARDREEGRFFLQFCLVFRSLPLSCSTIAHCLLWSYNHGLFFSTEQSIQEVNQQPTLSLTHKLSMTNVDFTRSNTDLCQA